ncbi:unnamed protein product [Ectocarpus sp. 12 AP-2014]
MLQHLRYLTLATAAVLPSCSSAFASSVGASSFVRHARHSGLSPRNPGHGLGFLALGGGRAISSRGGGSGSGSGSKTAVVMGLEVVPVLGGLESAAALFAGHGVGVVVGVATVLWSTVLKTPISESSGAIKSAAGVAGSVLTFLTVTMLGVRTYTAGPDTRYIDSFPTGIAHPEGCTRIAEIGGNKGIAVPTFKASVDEVQGVAKAWLESQPRTTIETDTPGYLHAKSLSLLFGFPDSVGVKIFKNKAGATEVWVQSELRVGQSDLDVNYNRMKAFLGHLGTQLK